MQEPNFPVTIETNVDEDAQRSNFQNATLQQIGSSLALSIATVFDVPTEIIREGQATVAGYVVAELHKASVATGKRVTFGVQLGEIDPLKNYDPAKLKVLDGDETKGPAPEAVKTAASMLGIEFYIDLALAHGRDSEPDHEVGDLQDFLRALWALCPSDVRRSFALSPIVYSTIEGAGVDTEETGIDAARELIEAQEA